MILYILRKNTNTKSAAYGKYYAFPVIEETVDLDALSEHMANHNTPYSKGAIKGVLTDMVNCIKELLLEGKNVKISDLAIFSLGIKNNGGAAKAEDFTVSKHIKGVKFRARATGELVAKNLNLEASLKKASATTKSVSGEGTTPTGGGTSTGGGSQDATGNYRLAVFKYGSGTSTVTDGSGQEINNNDNVAAGTTLNISVVPAAGKVPKATYDGSTAIALTEKDGTYTGSFQMPGHVTTLEINSEPEDTNFGY